MQLRRADTTFGDDQELANVTYNDKYVVVYDFSSVGMLPWRSSRLHEHWIAPTIKG
jgi:hypothetical protein